MGLAIPFGMSTIYPMPPGATAFDLEVARFNRSTADDATAFDLEVARFNRSTIYPMPPGAFLQVTTENCLVTWSTAKGSFR